jgi:hypothetical protein
MNLVAMLLDAVMVDIAAPVLCRECDVRKGVSLVGFPNEVWETDVVISSWPGRVYNSLLEDAFVRCDCRDPGDLIIHENSTLFHLR